jgi:hypothetical protein
MGPRGSSRVAVRFMTFSSSKFQFLDDGTRSRIETSRRSTGVLVAISEVLVPMAFTKSLANEFYTNALSPVISVVTYILRRRAMLPAARFVTYSSALCDAGSV